MSQDIDAISFLRSQYGGAQAATATPTQAGSAIDWLRSELTPPAPESPGALDYAGQGASSFAKGALETGRLLLDLPATVGTAGASLFGLNKAADTAKTLSPHYWAARGLQALERMVPTNEKVDAEEGGAAKWVSETGMNALGSTVPFLGIGMIAKGAGATARAATAITALTGASVNAVSGYEDAIRSGATPEQAFGAMLVNGGLGALEAATPARILARIDAKLGGGLGKAITNAFLEGGTEAMTETIQQLGQDAYAAMTFDEQREVSQGLADAAGGGGFAGVLMSLLGSGMARGHQQATTQAPPKDGAQPAPSQAAPGAPAQTPAMSEGTFSKPIETADPRVQEAMQRIGKKAGVPVSVVEDQTGYEWEAERAKMAGSPLVLFRVGDGKATEGAPTGFSKGGVTFLNADLPVPERKKAVLYHELNHRLFQTDEASWEAKYSEVEVLAPELLKRAGDRYEAEFGEKLTPQAKREEAYSALAEELPGFIRAWEEDPGQFKETKRGFVRRIIDWITEKLGGTSSVKKELLALRDSIAETDLEKTADPALLRDVSRSFSAGLAELEKSKPAEPIGSVAKEASPSDEGKFAVAPQGRFDIPDESRSDKFLRKIQDRYIRLKRIQEGIAKKQPVSDEANAEQKVRLFPSRLRDRYEKVEKFSNSVVEHLVKSNISVEDAGMFVYALGAEQRNATMAKRYPRKFGNVANPGSGITTAEAQKILRKSYSKNKAGYEWIRDQVVAANKAKLDLAQESGFLNDEARRKWEEDFGQYHAPLYTWEKDSEDAFTGYGSKSFNNAERITKTAKGRRSIADNPLVNLIDSMAKWSLRAESNRVGRSLGKLVEEAPDASLWEPIDSMSKAKPEDQVFTYWEDGEKKLVIIHDSKLARAMKAIGVEPAGELLRMAQGVRTFYSKLHTSWNPEFLLPNLAKDTLAAAATLNLEQGPAFTAKALSPARIKDSLMAIVADQHGRKHKLSKDVAEWKERGGMTGWNLQPETLRKRFDQLKKEVERAKADTTGKQITIAFLKGKRIIEDFSSATENAVRFSVYRAFVEAGVSPDEAARQSKTITIDFDSRGEISTPFNVLYLFFNANVQGTARIFQALKRAPPKRTLALASSMVSLGFLVSFLNRLMSDDDENGVNRWDTVSQNDKAHNLSLMFEDKRVLLPQPWGWSLFTYLGQQMEQLQNGRYKPTEALGDLLTQSADSFSPVQGSTPTQVMAPWFADPFIQVQENKDFAGRSIMPREDPFRRYKTPDSYRYFPDVNPSLKAAADALNRWTGGNAVEPGVLDVSPETMEFMLGESAGGFGRSVVRFANMLDKLSRGEGVKASEIPAVRRFLQEPPSWFTYSLFSDNLTEVEKHEELRKQGMKFDAAVVGQGRATRNHIEDINRAMKRLPDGPVKERLEERKLQAEQRFNRFMESRNK